MGCLKTRISNDEVLIGCWINLFDRLSAEIIGATGYDVAMIDLEHGPGSVMDALGVMQALGPKTVPLARAPANDKVWIKRILDAGARGIMAPAIDDAEAARDLVAACHYAPRGVRGMAAVIVRASGYGADWRNYVAEIEEQVLVIGQIESATALENLDDIAAVPGLDMLFIGPFDLSASLGYLGEPDHPEVLREISRVEAVARAAGKALGCIATPGRDVGGLAAAGYRLILPDADLALLRDGARASLAKWRAAVGAKDDDG